MFPSQEVLSAQQVSGCGGVPAPTTPPPVGRLGAGGRSPGTAGVGSRVGKERPHSQGSLKLEWQAVVLGQKLLGLWVSR